MNDTNYTNALALYMGTSFHPTGSGGDPKVVEYRNL